MVSNVLSWITVARKYIGISEIHGPQNNPEIVNLWKEADVAGVHDDETPWCAAFVSAVLEEAGVVSARTGWARNYLKWGVKLDGPAFGSVVVFERGVSSGHVGFVIGKDSNNNLVVLGGNQGDMVKLSPFTENRVLGYRWPNNVPLPTCGLDVLDVVSINAAPSTNEA